MTRVVLEAGVSNAGAQNVSQGGFACAGVPGEPVDFAHLLLTLMQARHITMQQPIKATVTSSALIASQISSTNGLRFLVQVNLADLVTDVAAVYEGVEAQ